MREHRTFASWIEGVELRYAVNGFFMGSTLNSPGKFEFNIEVKTRSDLPGEQVRRIQILRNHPVDENEVEVAAEALFDENIDVITWAPVIEDTTSGYFLLRIYHAGDLADDGTFKPDGSTVSAPVWTGR